MAAAENSINDHASEKLQKDNDKDDYNENVKKRLKHFATSFHKHFHIKKDIYFAEYAGEVKKKPTSTKVGGEVGAGMAECMIKNNLGIRIQKGFDSFGQHQRQQKAKAIFSVLKDTERVLNTDVIRGACLLFQMYEVQFMKITVDGKLNTAMDYLAKDAVKRLFDFVKKLEENPESNTTIDHNFIVNSILMEYNSKIPLNNTLMLLTKTVYNKIVKGLMKYDKQFCKTEDIFSRVGLIIRHKNSDGSDNTILCKRKINDGSDLFGFRLNHNSETKIPTGYREIDVNCNVYKKNKTEICERYLNSETLEKLFDDVCLSVNQDKLVWFNVKDPVPSFIGRDEQLEWISKNLEKGPIFIVGLNGVGKSELTLKHVSLNYKQGQHNVVWINAENEQSTTMSFKELHGGYMRLKSKTEEDTEKSISIIKEEVYDYFKNQNVLFVYDNIRDRNIIDTFSPANLRPRLNTIYTSNSIKSEKSDESTIKLMGFTPQETVKIIQMYLPFSIEEDIHKLGKAMNNSPLGLKIAASFIKASKSNITTFLNLLENSNQDKFEFLKRSDECTKSIYSINITLEHLKSLESDDSKFAVEILKIAAFTSPDQIPLNVFKSIQYQRLTNIQKDDLRHKSAQGKVNRALELLDEYSLLEHRQENDISVHRLVQLTIHQTIIQESAENAESIIENILKTILEAAGSKKYRLHISSAWKHAVQLTSDELWKGLIEQFIANRNGSYSHFHGICENNEFEVVDRVLHTIKQHYSASSFDINEQNAQGNTAIHLAARRVSQKIFQILIENKAKLNINNTNHCTPLHHAANSGHADIVAEILKYPEGMQILNAKTGTGSTAMHCAAANGNLSNLQMLIEKGAEINITDTDLRTILHYAAINGHANIVAEILKHREGMLIINAKTETGYTAMHCGAAKGDLRIVQMLIKNGAELNIKDMHLHTPLHCAAINGQTNIVAEILKHRECKQILNAKTGTGSTAMHCGAAKGHLRIVQMLIKNGAELNITNLHFHTPLHCAATNGHSNIVAEIQKQAALQCIVLVPLRKAI